MRPASNPPFNMASAPTVYRSLPMQMGLPAQPTVGLQQPFKAELLPLSNKEGAAIRVAQQQEKPTMRFPVAPFPGLVNNPIVKENVDLVELHKSLSAACSSCELKRNSSLCEFTCVAQAEDGNEQCKFSVSLWDIPHSSSKCLVQVDRHAGCPFFFRQIVSKTIGSCCLEDERCSKPVQAPRLFRAPKLPMSFVEDEPKIDQKDVESAIALALSKVYEQRIQGALVLADLCSGNKAFAEAFKSMNGVDRIASLKTDSNSYIQRAVARILVSV